MTVLDFLNKYVVVINSIILVILVIRYLQDLRRYHLDYKKLSLELEKLRDEMQKRNRTVIEASPDQVNKYVIEPLSEEIRRAAKELGGRVESFSQTQSDLMGNLGQVPMKTSNELKEIASYLRQLVAMTEEIMKIMSKLQKLKLRVGLDEET
jgi:DNA repair exonuclease SbcCD ATPase subunit